MELTCHEAKGTALFRIDIRERIRSITLLCCQNTLTFVRHLSKDKLIPYKRIRFTILDSVVLMQINSSTENRHESNDVDTALCLHRTITCLYNINTQAQSVCHRLSWPHEVENQGRTSEGHFKRNLSRAPPQSFSFPAKASPSLEWTYGGLDFPPLNLQAIEYYMHIS